MVAAARPIEAGRWKQGGAKGTCEANGTRGARGRFGVSGTLALAAALALGILAGPASAASFCVSTAAELTAALQSAEVNGEDDIVRIREGLYAGNFSYFAGEAKSIQILGGYSLVLGSCVRLTDDPAATVLQSPNLGEVLAMVASGPATAATPPLFRVQQLTLQNGGRSLRLTNALNDQKIDFEVSRNLLLGATGSGLLMNVIDGDVRIENNVFSGISSDELGVAMNLKMPHVNSGSTLFVLHNTVAFNQALDANSSHISITGAAGNEVTVANNIIRDNGWVDLSFDSALDTVIYNNDYQLLIGTPDFSSGNVDLDAGFVDAPGHDFRLRYDSAVRNVGHSNPPGGLPATDIVGNPRIQSPLPDLGAYEVPWVFANGFEVGFIGWSTVVN